MVASRDVLLSYMMEYWALVLILGLFHTPSVVHTVSATNDKETTEDRLKRMEEKIDRLQELLYKGLVAEESKMNLSIDDVCSKINDDNGDNDAVCDIGDLNCTSINLLAKESKCQICEIRDWKSVNGCEAHYGTKAFDIIDEDKGIRIHIDHDGVPKSNIADIDPSFVLKPSELKCDCIPSRYSATNISHLVALDEKKHLLFCECEEKPNFHEDHYCLEEGEDNTAVCYERMSDNCNINEGKVSCTTKPVANSGEGIKIITEEDCQSLAGHTNCQITTVSVSDSNIEFNPHRWKDGDAIITCGDKKCPVPLMEVCKDISKLDACTKPTPAGGGSGDDDDDDDDDKSNYTVILILIIIILVLLLLSYYGYHNQWHHTISSCVNGTEGEAARPAPSNRRGRMKGKYAPLPRSMEETLPRHDD